MKISKRYEIRGLVQGVGFRPFVYNLATRYKINGEIYNDDEGVKLNFYADTKALESFESALFKELPALARIDDFKVFSDDKSFDTLLIIASKSAKKQAAILPDFALCDECEREFYDPKNRRYKYPFINCTNCGPRFSIIKSLPYDRINTTMSVFTMCKECQNEYENPLDRRYHAQPTSCVKCGPKLMLKDLNAKILSTNDEAIKQTARLIKQGKILAIKGLGGFHLVCDATNKNALKTLRERKNRPDKPFALMCKNLENAKKIAQISKKESELLSSNLKPIVLLKAKKNEILSNLVAPNLDVLGIMLPFSGIHLALFEHLDCDIVATSANISGEPVIYDEKEILRLLSGVVDYYLDHDREIYSPSDDSIAFLTSKDTHYVRTSRGLNPYFKQLKCEKKGVFLALGAELKNQFCIYNNGELIISPYIGDLKNVSTFDRFKSVLELFKSVYELKFDMAIADLHPHFLNLKYAKEQGIKTIQIQHHYAHLLAVMFENNLDCKNSYLGFCFDGTGYGDDGQIWGGEVLKIDGAKYQRLWHFDDFVLFGGENSIKNIYQIAYSIILKYGLEQEASKFLVNFDQKRLKMLKNIYKSDTKRIKTSSLGRIFDAFCSIILGLESISYEAQSGMELEQFYDKNLEYSYKFELENGGIINFKNAFKMALKDDKIHAVTGFINAIVDIVINIAKEQKCEILLSGGVFQNRVLLEALMNKFDKQNIKYYYCKRHTNNDTNICLGQMYFLLYLI
ncbi:[Ni-Fe] hydrogenase maturation protein HypF [Campylobacter mucosalis]|uniref:carbamoyltransferase HypF n=1 Tax=Campylobacter mucosalis TaxID=202 RepID=UPI00159483CB|nr:carbamoyltransferase HypF [Campylobacter mucosalis]QKF63072.1 [Ni-Fe] hydrogenase maturation protein HypF [Campylobacter mucosalis]